MKNSILTELLLCSKTVYFEKFLTVSKKYMIFDIYILILNLLKTTWPMTFFKFFDD